MSRKHYKMIADTIRKNLKYATKNVGEAMVIETLAVELCIDFAGDNPNFDQAKFLAACGIER